MASITPIIKVGTTDISSYVEYGPVKGKGGDRNVKSDPIIGSNQAVVWEEGRDPISWDLGLLFRTTLADQIGTADTITALIDDLAGDQDTGLFYPGRDDRFAVIEKGSVHDPYTRREGGGAGLYKDATLYSKATELYSATPSSWSPTDEILPITQSSGETNAGNIPAGLYSLVLTARMAGPALQLDGSDDYVDFGAVDLSGDELSIIFWIKPTATGDYGGFSNGTAFDSAGHCFFYLDEVSGAPTAFPTVAYYNGSTQYVTATSGISTWEDTWLCLGFSYDKTNNQLKFFVNGAQLGTTVEPATALTSVGSTNVSIGNLPTPLYIDAAYAGLRVWKRILTADEFEDAYLGETVSATSLAIDCDFTDGSGATLTDNSGNDNDGTLTNFADTTAGYGDDHDGGWLTNVGPVSLELELLDGATVVADLVLADTLKSGEVLEVDRFGQIYQMVEYDFDANTGRRAFGGGYFNADVYDSSSAAESGGSLVISTDGYAIFELPGVFPIAAGGLLLTFTPTESGTGVASLDVSPDGGTTWETVKDNSDEEWTDGEEMEVYVPPAEGETSVQIRFICDASITSLSLASLKIEQWRYVSDSLVPKIPVNETRIVQINGTPGGWVGAAMERRNRYKP